MDLVIAMIPWAYGTQKRTQYSVLSFFRDSYLSYGYIL